MPSFVEEGAFVAAQDIEECWYGAQVLAVKEDAALVHYLGWEDHWDEWLEASRLAVMPKEQKPVVTEEDLSPEAFEARRKAGKKMNNLWQFGQFSESFCGFSFEGTCDRYVLVEESLKLVRTHEASVKSTRLDTLASSEKPKTAKEVDDRHANLYADFIEKNIFLTEDTTTSRLELRPIFFEHDDDSTRDFFAANADSFTTARLLKDEVLENDIWVKRGDRLLGLRVAYSKKGDDYVFEYADVRKLASPGTTFLQENLFGTGIHEPHPYLTNSLELRLPDAITLAFPRFFSAKGALSLDWTHGTLRSQVDRVFQHAQLSSFEITDILVDKQHKLQQQPPDDPPQHLP